MLDVIIININFKYPPHVSFLNLSSMSFDIFLNALVIWVNFRHDDGLSEKLFCSPFLTQYVAEYPISYEE